MSEISPAPGGVLKEMRLMSMRFIITVHEFNFYAMQLLFEFVRILLCFQEEMMI